MCRACVGRFCAHTTHDRHDYNPPLPQVVSPQSGPGLCSVRRFFFFRCSGSSAKSVPQFLPSWAMQSEKELLRVIVLGWICHGGGGCASIRLSRAPRLSAISRSCMGSLSGSMGFCGVTTMPFLFGVSLFLASLCCCQASPEKWSFDGKLTVTCRGKASPSMMGL